MQVSKRKPAVSSGFSNTGSFQTILVALGTRVAPGPKCLLRIERLLILQKQDPSPTKEPIPESGSSTDH